LIAYRNAHGKINGQEDLIKALLIDEAAVKKLLPYCRF
jgi:hypothetical protein